MLIEVTFPRNQEGQRVEVYSMVVVPQIGAGITTDGNDHWTVQDVVYATSANALTGVVAQVRVR